MWSIPVEGQQVSAEHEEAEQPGRRVVFACAHGAGGHMADRGVLQVTQALRGKGISTVRFNFPYREKKSGRPDGMPLLKQTVGEVAARVKRELNPDLLILGGRSMGGRAASMLAADGFACDGLLLLAYPLHSAGKPEQLRDAHLPKIEVPVICFNGTRDPLCTPALMERVLETVGANWTMHWLQGADHSFHVLKSSGTNDAAVLEEVAGASQKWVAGLRVGAD